MLNFDGNLLGLFLDLSSGDMVLIGAMFLIGWEDKVFARTW